MDIWNLSYDKKPDPYIIVDVITHVGKHLEVVEGWWNGDSWNVRSIRSRIISVNIIAWTYKREIPKEIMDEYL